MYIICAFFRPKGHSSISTSSSRLGCIVNSHKHKLNEISIAVHESKLFAGGKRMHKLCVKVQNYVKSTYFQNHSIAKLFFRTVKL